MSSTTLPEAGTITTDRTPASRGVERDVAGSWATSRTLLLAVLGVSAVYVFWHLDRGWVPYDDGALAEGAARLMRGQLPHRDFDGIYTGGLDYLNALAFGIFGTTLFAIRLMLYVTLLAWVPAVHYVASRLVKPLAAAAVTLLAVVWSVPNYPAAMPSWYNLFLATFGVAALFRYLETNRARWLVLAGVAGGLSFLVKVVGLYYVAGVLLFLVFHAHATSRANAAPGAGERGSAYAVFVSLALLAFVAALAGVVRHQAYAPEIVQFVVPGSILAAMLALAEWTEPAGASRVRFATLARLIVPFLLGVALPVALFVVPYLRSGSLGSLATGVFVLPMKRFGSATWRALPLLSALALLPPVLVVAAMHWLRAPLRGWKAVLVAAVFALLLLGAAHNDRIYRGVWYALRNLMPVLTLAGVVVLSRRRAADEADPLLRARTMVLLCVTALSYLVQFPFSVPIYFCYVAPLVALSAVALSRYLRSPDRVVLSSALGFSLAFGVWLVNDATIAAMGASVLPYPGTVPMGVERGGLQVWPQDAAELRVIVSALRQRAKGGYTWASPDCPEVYFLSGLKNPTRTLFDFFDDSTGRTARVLKTLDDRGVTAIVLNGTPAFSEGITMEMYAQLQQRYPFHVNVGRFQLRWRS